MSRIPTRVPKPVPDTAGKTENFFSRNVRTITFLICLGVLLATIGPISIFQIVKWANGRRAEPQGKTMTAEDVIRLSENPSALRFDAFREYAGTYSEGEYVKYYYIEFDTRYLLVVTADRKTGAVKACLVSDLQSEAEADLMRDDIRAFFESTSGR